MPPASQHRSLNGSVGDRGGHRGSHQEQARKNKILYSIITVTVLTIIVGYFYSIILFENVNEIAQEAGVAINHETVQNMESLSVKIGEENLPRLKAILDRHMLISRIMNQIVMPVLLLTGTWFNIKRFRY